MQRGSQCSGQHIGYSEENGSIARFCQRHQLGGDGSIVQADGGNRNAGAILHYTARSSLKAAIEELGPL